MNSFTIAFLIVSVSMLLLLPRRWASLPFLTGVCYMTIAQGIEIGPFGFTMIRILVAAGFLRIIIRGERLRGGINSLDWMIVLWATWALISSIFWSDPAGALIFRLGLVYNTCGIYFLFRIFCQSMENLLAVVRIMAIILTPVALEMLYEKMAGYNLFSFLGGVPLTPQFRDGFRAQGPFRHAILAGSVGAVCLPLMIGLWRQDRKHANLGIGACLAMIFASGSSGPILSAMAGIGALLCWRIRHRMRLVRWLAVVGYIGLDLVMKAPAYYLIARTGMGGTGWHRARLIESSIEHLHEWWLAGTDYTRHWMPTGVSWSPDHADITNHYIQMGVLGGLPLMFLFILILRKGFVYLGETIKNENYQNSRQKYFIWTLGASLFANAATMISVSYFDQSFLFLYLTLAAIGSLWSAVVPSAARKETAVSARFSVKSKMQPSAGK